MNPMIAVCGLNCAECEAYLATQADDQAAKERVAAKWRQEYNAPGITVDYVTCDGCLTVGGRKGGHCAECNIRACGVAHQVLNCAHCSEYNSCEKIAGFLNFVPRARINLDGIRRQLV